MVGLKGKVPGFGRWSLRAAAAALVALGVVAGVAATPTEELPVPDADQTVGPARKTGGGFEFRRKLSSVNNPYCDIATYVLPDFPRQALSTRTADDRSVIVIDASILLSDRPYGHFLMAHECCHHTLGHTLLTAPQQGGAFYYLRPLLRNMELDADGCAVRTLKLTKEPGAIERARLRMLEFADERTGPYYPTGTERAENIARTAAED